MARRNKTTLPKHVSLARDRHGKIRYRFRKGLFSAYLNAVFPSDDFDRLYHAALKNETVAQTRIGKTRERI